MIRVRSDYNKIISALDVDTLEKNTKQLFRAVSKYYKKYPSHGTVDFTLFVPEMDRAGMIGKDDEEKQVFRNIIKNMIANYPDEETRAGILESVHQNNLMHRAMIISEKWVDGEDIDPVSEIQMAMDKYMTAVGFNTMPEVSENIDELLEGMDNDAGVHWRLGCLNKHMRPLRGGDFGVLAARPDQGKTSFLASELTFMVPQLPEGRPALWLNNEGPGYAIRPRLMQAALNCTTEDLIEKKEAGKLYDEYFEAVGGQNKIRIMDIQGYNVGQVEALIAETNPGLIIYDMIDNIHGFGDSARNDLMLEKMYQWARERAVKYDAIALATSQISSEGANTQYPGLSMLKDSKTGKQGACDFQLMIGSIENKAEYRNTRWLSLPKNKLRRLSSGVLQASVKFDRDRARYRDLEKEVEVDNDTE